MWHIGAREAVDRTAADSVAGTSADPGGGGGVEGAADTAAHSRTLTHTPFISTHTHRLKLYTQLGVDEYDHA